MTNKLSWLAILLFSVGFSAAVAGAETEAEKKKAIEEQREKTRRAMLKAAGIDPDKKKDEKAAGGTKPANAAPPGVPNEYTFNVSGMM